MKFTFSSPLKLLTLIAIDFIFIWLWVYQMNPDPSVSIGILLLTPFIFTLNLVMAGISYALKKRGYMRLFIINSVLSSIMMGYLFQKGIDRYQNNRLESWEFSKADTTYSLIRWKEVPDFDMSYSTSPGLSTEFLTGKYIFVNNTYVLTADSTKYIIKGNYLFGFKGINNIVKLKKIER
jgi:hypothetical protein